MTVTHSLFKVKKNLHFKLKGTSAFRTETIHATLNIFFLLLWAFFSSANLIIDIHVVRRVYYPGKSKFGNVKSFYLWWIVKGIDSLV